MDDNTIEFARPDDTGGTPASGTPDPAGGPRRAKWSGRTKRVVTTVAASTILLGSGAAIGVALTGGASASTGGTSPGTAANTTAATTAASSAAGGRCASLVERLTDNDHPVAAKRLRIFCKSALVRLALVGGEHGEVTFQTKAGPKTIAVERGTVQGISNTGITVVAKDGTTWTWNYTTNTVVREAHEAVGRSSLNTGETVLVLGQVVGGVHDARLIRIHG